MKKIKIEKKLVLKKEMVTKLNQLEMKNIQGGNLSWSLHFDDYNNCTSCTQ